MAQIWSPNPRNFEAPEILEAHRIWPVRMAGGRRDEEIEEEGPARVLSRGPVIIVLRFLPRITRYEIWKVATTFLLGLRSFVDSRVDWGLF